MPKISVIGICGNSVFMRARHFHQRGETLVADSVYEEIGGKGINQAIAAKRMGAEVAFLAAVGDDSNGIKCSEEAKKNGIDAHLIIKKGKRTPFAFILTDSSGDNRVTVYKDAELNSEDVAGFENEIKNSDVLLIQNEVPAFVNEAAVRLAQKHGVKVVLNPAPGRDISDEMANAVFVVTPNEQERTMIDAVKFENCITTLGDKGCMINEDVFIPAISVKSVDTTGAGDTFNGVLAVCIAEGMELEKACRYAVAASGLSVEKITVIGSIPYRKDIEKIVSEL